jgi:hypothetical protein
MWYVCPHCIVVQDSSLGILWSDSEESRMSLTNYVKLCNEGKPPQETLGILKCLVHSGFSAPRRIQPIEYQSSNRVYKGGIVDSDTRVI